MLIHTHAKKKGSTVERFKLQTHIGIVGYRIVGLYVYGREFARSNATVETWQGIKSVPCIRICLQRNIMSATTNFVDGEEISMSV